MPVSFAQLQKYRGWFTQVFALSLIVLLVSSSFLSFNVMWHSEQLNLVIIISITSLLTSAASLVGLFLVTYIALHKERRERQSAALDAD